MTETPPAIVSGALALDRRRFNRFSELITRELGIRMPPSKLTMLQSRLQRRMRELGIASLDQYESYVFDSGKNADEMVHFFDIVTTNKTDFFREPQHFEYLVRKALPTLAQENGLESRWPFKLWCAGCSSGQEVYTLGMTLSEYEAARIAGLASRCWPRISPRASCSRRSVRSTPRK